MELTKIAEKKWSYTLYKSEQGYVLSVLCGGSAMYEINVLLTPDEEAKVLAGGNALDEMASSISDNPNAYLVRNIQL
jgi:hypothetical protein